MTHKLKRILLIVALVLLLGCLLSAALVVSAATTVTSEKVFVHLSGISSGATRKNNVDGSDTGTIETNGIYLTMANNNLPFANGDWDNYRYSSSSNSAVMLNGNGIGGTLIKYGANSYYLSFNNEASNGCTLVVSGTFGSGDNSVTVSPALFTYNSDEGVWSQVRPTFGLQYNGQTYSQNTLKIAPGTKRDDVTAVASGVSSDIATLSKVAVTWPTGTYSTSKVIVLNNNETHSVHTVTVTATYKLAGSSTEVAFEEYMDVAVEYDFTMKNGAKLALFDQGGLTFGAEISKADYELLDGYTFKCALIEKATYDSYAATSTNIFVKALVNKATKTVNCEVVETESGYLLTGTFTPIDSANFTTEYVGIIYAQSGSTYRFANFFGDDVQNNTRSCYYLAQLCVDANDNAQLAENVYLCGANENTADLVVKTIVYGNGAPQENVISTETCTVNTVVTKNAPTDVSGTLVSAGTVQQRIYANRTNEVVFEYVSENTSSVGIAAWFLPLLTPENDYQNENNFSVVAEMKEAGLNSVVLDGSFVGYMSSVDDVERMRQLIALFDMYGIGTYVNCQKNFYALDEYPDFRGCSGFLGFVQWDEPFAETIVNVLPQYAKEFDEIYGDSAEFWCNLFPNEAKDNAEGFGEYNGSTLKDYATYLQLYCDNVLSQINKGTKVLSVDSYPIKTDYSLDASFLTSIGLLKYYAMEYGAKTNICLQSCGWDQGGSKDRMPTEQELRLQAYAALAFGMDSITWFTYSQFQSETNQTADMVPVDYETGAKGTGYTALQKVNNELLAFADVYANFAWEGTIFNFGSSSGEKSGYTALQSTAFGGKYELSASNTQFSSISVKNNTTGIGSSHSVLTGVFTNKTDSSEKGYAFCNYDSCKDGGKTATVTLKSSTTLTATIYRNGGTETVTIDSNGYKLTLDGGEGCFITCK